jgi:hypothetical protein
MRISAALVLIAVGAILRFALVTVVTHGIYRHSQAISYFRGQAGCFGGAEPDVQHRVIVDRVLINQPGIQHPGLFQLSMFHQSLTSAPAPSRLRYPS